MNGRNTQNSGGGIGGMLRFIGFLTAVVFVIGFLNKAGMRISFEGREDGPSFLSASLADEDSGDVIVIRPEDAGADHERAYPQAPRAYESRSSGRSGSAGKEIQVEDWIDKYAGTAVMQALSRGVPAGIALAVGVAELRSGNRISSWNDFMEKVIEPLAGAKQRDDLRTYFKYSANSELWAEGLERTGRYSAATLQRIMDQYQLGDFDEVVRTRLTSGTTDPETERKAGIVADEVTATLRERRNAPAAEAYPRETVARSAVVREAEAIYDELVGREVAKEIARNKLKSGQYISEEDMTQLVEETNEETSEVLQHNLGFMGRRINPDHPGAAKAGDITDPKNAQAREQLYQTKLQEKRRNSRKKPR